MCRIALVRLILTAFVTGVTEDGFVINMELVILMHRSIYNTL